MHSDNCSTKYQIYLYQKHKYLTYIYKAIMEHKLTEWPIDVVQHKTVNTIWRS